MDAAGVDSSWGAEGAEGAEEAGEAGGAGEAGEAGGAGVVFTKVFTRMSLNVISVTNLSLPYPTLSNQSVKSVF